MLSRPQLHVALRQQGWAVVSLQQRILSCLEHKAWLQEASDVLSAIRAVEATRIQSAWRHKEACHRAISAIWHHDMERNRQQVEQAASILQRAMLGKWSRSRLRKLHRNELSKVLGAAATDIQRVWCGHASRNLVRNRINLVELQRYNQERHHTLALRLQLGMRCFWARRELTDRYWETKSQLACTAIQCAARVWLARNEFQIHIFEEVQRRKISAVLTVQAFGFSSAPARRRPLARCVFVASSHLPVFSFVGLPCPDFCESAGRFWRERRETSATVLAAVYKAHLVRLDMQDLRFENQQVEYATTLQRIFRAHRARVVACQRLRVVARDYQHAAALCLQTAMRAKWARVALQRVGMLHLETYRLRQQAEMMRKIHGSRALQGAIRSCLARELVLRPERANRQMSCARVLSRVYRGHIGRLLAQRRMYERVLEATMKIKSAYRLHLARLLCRRTMERNRLASILSFAQNQQASAALIQHAYFMHVSRLILRDRASEVMMCTMRRSVARAAYSKHLGASTLQAAMRRQACRQKLQLYLASDTLVATVRRVFMRNKCRRKLAARNLTAAALSALIRQSYVSKLAADTISATAAAFFARRRGQAEGTAGQHLATAAQRCVARHEYRKHHACVRVQSVVRGHMDREWIRAYGDELRQHRHLLSCIVKIQATERGHLARLAVGAIQELEGRIEACHQLQIRCRRALASDAYNQHLLELHRSKWAKTLQRYWRGALARHRRKLLTKLKLQTRATCLLQRILRGHYGRVLRDKRIIEIKRTNCAVVLQAWFRGFLGKDRADAIRDLNSMIAAATIIQAGARGMKGRSRARYLRDLRIMEHSAVNIQARARGMFGRAKAELRREEIVWEAEIKNQMAIKIQTGYRQHLARQAYLTATDERGELDFYRSYCADILQCNARCFNARSRMRKRLRAAVLITALGRGFQARRKVRKRREILEKQPLYVSPHKLRPERYVVPPGQDLRRPLKMPRAKQFRCEVSEPSLLHRQPSLLPWHVREKQAVQKFQSNPKIKAFFSGLQKREHGKGKSSKKSPTSKPPFKPSAPPHVNHVPEMMVARPASAMSHPPPLVDVMARPKSAMPAMTTKGRVPPRFQKVRQAKAAGGDSSAESASSLKKPKPRNQRPRARGSDSERNSDDEVASRSTHAPIAAAVPEPNLRPAISKQAIQPSIQASIQAPPRALYNKDEISSDPPSDEQRKKMSKSKDKEKRKERSVTPPPKQPSKAASPPPKPPSSTDPKIEVAFSHCRLGKYRDVEKALKEGVPVEARFGPDNNTMLLQCAQNGQKRIAKLLLRNFASMNAQNDKGDTAMHYCFKFKYIELGEYLKSKGADDTLRNSKGQTCYECQK